MNSFKDLNAASNLPLNFADQRAPKVDFNLGDGVDQYVTAYEDIAFANPVGIEILNIINGTDANIEYVIDLSSYPGATVTWDLANMPGHFSVEVTGGVYTLKYVQTVEEWTDIKVRSPLVLPPTNFNGNMIYNSKIVFGSVVKTWRVIADILPVFLWLPPAENIINYQSGSTISYNTATAPQISTYLPNLSMTVTITPEKYKYSFSSMEVTPAAGLTQSWNNTTKVLTLTGTRNIINTALRTLLVGNVSLTSDSYGFDVNLIFNVTYQSQTEDIKLRLICVTTTNLSLVRGQDFYIPGIKSDIIYAPYITATGYSDNNQFEVEISPETPATTAEITLQSRPTYQMTAPHQTLLLQPLYGGPDSSPPSQFSEDGLRLVRWEYVPVVTNSIAVYDWNGTQYVKNTQFNGATSGDFFGNSILRFSLSANGNVLAVSSNEIQNNNPGVVRIYVRDTTTNTWSLAKIIGSVPGEYDPVGSVPNAFGDRADVIKMSADGKQLLVLHSTTLGESQGVASSFICRVYKVTDIGAWANLDVLDYEFVYEPSPPAGEASATYNPVSFDNDTVIVSKSAAITNQKSIEAYVRGSEIWSQKSGSSDILNHLLLTPAYGSSPKIFMAVGNAGRVFKSNDGDTWTDITSGIGENINRVAVARLKLPFPSSTQYHKYVAVCDNLTIAYTTDFSGNTWLKASLATSHPTSTKLRDLCWVPHPTIESNPGTFVAVGQNGAIIRSTNGGSVWSDATSNTTADIRAICYNAGTYVAIARNSGGFVEVLTSTDSNNWTRTVTSISITDTECQIIYGNGKFVLAAGTKVFTSTNGSSWTQTATPATPVVSVSFFNNKFYFGTNANLHYVSFDAITLTSVSVAGKHFVKDLSINRLARISGQYVYTRDTIVWSNVYSKNLLPSDKFAASTIGSDATLNNWGTTNMICYETQDETLKETRLNFIFRSGISNVWTQASTPFKVNKNYIVNSPYEQPGFYWFTFQRTPAYNRLVVMTFYNEVLFFEFYKSQWVLTSAILHNNIPSTSFQFAGYPYINNTGTRFIYGPYVYLEVPLVDKFITLNDTANKMIYVKGSKSAYNEYIDEIKFTSEAEVTDSIELVHKLLLPGNQSFSRNHIIYKEI